MSGPTGSGQYGNSGGGKGSTMFDPMQQYFQDPGLGYGSGGGATGGPGGGGGGGGGDGAAAPEQFLGDGLSASNDTSNVLIPGATGNTLAKGAVFNPEGDLLGMNAGTGSEFGGGSTYGAQTTPGSFADQQRAIDARRRGAAPLTLAGLGAYFNNAQSLLSGTGAVMTGGISALEAALGLEPGALGGIQNIPGYTALPEFTGTPTMQKYQSMVQNAVGSPWGGGQVTDRGMANVAGQFGLGGPGAMRAPGIASRFGAAGATRAGLLNALSGIGYGGYGGYGGGMGGNAGGGYGGGERSGGYNEGHAEGRSAQTHSGGGAYG
jgi:hypothetical protein